MSNKIKSYLQIEQRFLGTLLYFKDKNNIGCLKLSFKNKIADFVKGTNIQTTLPVPVKLKTPISLDISYKFKDSLLEVKKIVNGRIDREFYKIPLPVSTYLFMIRIKDWNLLDGAMISSNPLVLTPPTQNNSVTIIFSFFGTNGQPIAPMEYDCVMRIIDLPENTLDKLCIGIAEDPTNTETNGFTIQLPIPID